jgi:AhpC/TSA family
MQTRYGWSPATAFVPVFLLTFSACANERRIDSPAGDPTASRSAPPVAPVGPSSSAPVSPAPRVGYGVGDRLGFLVVKDCDGRDVGLTNAAGARGLWIFAAHGWCPHCIRVSHAQEALAADWTDRGVSVVNVLVKNADNESPTAADCKAWKERHGFVRVVSLYDPDFRTRVLWEDNATALSVIMDVRHVVIAKFHGAGSPLTEALDALVRGAP